MGDQSQAGTAVPAALSNTRKIVKLPTSGENITVIKWSFTRALEVMAFVDERLQNIPTASADRLLKGTYFQVAMKTIQLLGKEMFYVMKLSVVEEDRKRITEEMDAEDAMTLIEVVAAVAILTVLNFFLKVSIHSAGMAGLVGFILAIGYKFPGHQLLFPIVFSILIAGLVMSARLFLNSHNPKEVLVGSVLGFSVCFLAVYVFA